MDLYVFNKDFRTVAVIDEYESFNWTDRYNEAGDFELILLTTSDLLDVFQPDYYLYFNQSEHLMFIEGKEIKTDDEDGDRLIVTGRSLESMLQRRIIWNKTKFNIAHSFQHAIVKMIINAMATPMSQYIGDWSETDEPPAANRLVSNLIVHRDWNAKWSPIKMDSIEYWGENLYDTVTELCRSRDPEVGFKITWRQSDNTFHFYLYLGTDHSSGNSEHNIPVSFSPRLENIFDTDYYETVDGYKTTALIIGQYPKSGNPNETEEKTTYVFRGSSLTTYTGLYRREVCCDSRSSVPYKDDNTDTIYDWDDVVKPALQEEGKKTLNETGNRKTKTFEGEVDYQTSYIYGTDYKLGDIVDVSDVYGHETKARIVEVTFSDDEEGFSINPSFEMFGEVIGVET